MVGLFWLSYAAILSRSMVRPPMENLVVGLTGLQIRAISAVILPVLTSSVRLVYSMEYPLLRKEVTSVSSILLSSPYT